MYNFASTAEIAHR